MLSVYEDAWKFTQPWASSFYSLVPHLWDKGSGKEEDRKSSVVLWLQDLQAKFTKACCSWLWVPEVRLAPV